MARVLNTSSSASSGIAASTYHKLKERFGISSSTRVFDVYQMLAEVERAVMERFGADVVGLVRTGFAWGDGGGEVGLEAMKPLDGDERR